MSDKPKWLQILAGFLIDNVTILLTIGYAGYIIIRQGSPSNPIQGDELLTAILGVLGLLATSEIVERYRRLNSIEKSNKRILLLMEGQFTDRPSAISFFRSPQNLDSFIAGANQIDLCGVTLTSTINKQFSNFRERLQEGANINVLVVDPNSKALEMSANRSGSPVDKKYFEKRLETTFNDIEYLYEYLSRFSSTNGNSKTGQLSVRLIPYAPSFGMISLNANQSNGTIFVEIYPSQSYDTQPSFDLTFQRDGKWYQHFVEQFEQMWQVATPWKPKTESVENET